MGTHPSGPSELADAPGTTLGAWLDAHPAALGAPTTARFGPVLPFLFKVLSVSTALSIQSHPDKALAEKLHASKPEWYKDDNHKPEMAIAVGDDFSALCGFEGPGGLIDVVEGTPELVGVVGKEAADVLVAAAKGAESDPAGFKAALKAAFTALMTAPPESYTPAVEALAARLASDAASTSTSPLASKNALVLKLQSQYPGDVGVLASLFLNYLTLEDGQAIALSANEPHAYVSGDLVECMATSDNVVRAGLTPKPRDVDVLCGSLTYRTGPPAVMAGTPLQEHTAVYAPPFDEFEVVRVALPAGKDTLLPPGAGPAIILVGRGAGGLAATELPLGVGGGLAASVGAAKGDVLFLPAGTPLRVEAGGEGGLTLWIAQVSARVLGPAPVVVPATPAAEPAAEPAGASA
jgi:mannose-6-phosphate isomerase